MSRIRRLVLLLALLLALGAGFLWLRGRPAPVEVPLPDLDGADPAVAAAIEINRKAVLADPRSPDAWGRLGMVLAAHGFSEQAVACLARAAERAPDEPRWPYLSGVLLADTDPQSALALWRRAAQGAVPAFVRLRLGGLLYSMGEADGAAHEYRLVLEEQPEDGHARLGLARVLAEQGQVEQALIHLGRAVEAPATRRGSHALLAELYQRKQDPARAALHRRLAEAAPEDTLPVDPWVDEMGGLQVGEQAALKRADKLLLQGQPVQAAELLERAAQDYPGSATVWLLLGRSLLRTRQLPLAERALREAYRLAPGRPQAAFYMGVVLFEQGDHREAQRFFARAVRLRPDHGVAWFNLAQCRKMSGDHEGAVTALEKALLYQPQHLLAHLELAQLLADTRRYGRARRQLEEARRLAPDDPRVIKLLRQLPAPSR